MERYEHGGKIYDDKIKYDFSVNISPLGLPDFSIKALSESVHLFSQYPDPDNLRLRTAISKHENINISNIVCGNGAAELIYKIVSVIKPYCTLITSPTFSEYEKAILENDSLISVYERKECNGFSLGEDFLDMIDDNIDLIFLCIPNNPDGTAVSKDLLAKIIRKCEALNSILVIDECFIDFTDLDYRDIELSDNVIVLKAFTKIFAMAGLRLGYAFSNNRELINDISEYGQCWNVSVAAEVAGVAALSDKSYVERVKQLIKTEKEYLCTSLHNIGIKTYASEANYILFTVEHSKFSDVDRFIDYLLDNGIYIRDCINFEGLTDKHFRIAVKKHEDNVYLIETMRRYLDG